MVEGHPVSGDFLAFVGYLLLHHLDGHFPVGAARSLRPLEASVYVLHVQGEMAEQRFPVGGYVLRVGHLVDLAVLELEPKDVGFLYEAHPAPEGDDRGEHPALLFLEYLYIPDLAGLVVFLADEDRVSLDRRAEYVLLDLERRLHLPDVDVEVQETVIALGEYDVLVIDLAYPKNGSGDQHRRDHPVQGNPVRLHRRNLVFGGELPERHQGGGHHRHWND